MKKTLNIALVLIIAGLLSFVVRGVIVAKTPDAAEAPDTAEIAALRVDLPKGSLIGDADIAWIEVDRAGVPADAVLRDGGDGFTFAGTVAKTDLTADVPLLTSAVILPGEPGFLAAALKPDMRAVSVPVNDVSSNAGLIKPGDHVDLVLVQDLSRETRDLETSFVSETVAKNIRVIAVGSDIRRADPEDSDIASSAANRRGDQVRTVTLEVSPKTAEMIIVAARLGELSLVLRSFATANRDMDANLQAQAIPAALKSESDLVWTRDVSAAVKSLRPEAEPQVEPVQQTEQASPAPVQTKPVTQTNTVTIFRGSERGEDHEFKAN